MFTNLSEHVSLQEIILTGVGRCTVVLPRCIKSPFPRTLALQHRTASPSPRKLDAVAASLPHCLQLAFA